MHFQLITIGILIALIATLTLWLIAFFRLSDFSYPHARTNEFKKVLLIFPHPDDEVLTCGGLIKKLSERGVQITDLILTKGEKGQEGAIFDPKLKEIRANETQNVGKILGLSKVILDDFGDGELTNKKAEVADRIKQVVEEEKPNLVITYDKSGLYGHPDHIVVSEIVTNILSVGAEHVQPGVPDFQSGRAQHVVPLQNIKLWYVSFPPKFYTLTKLPTHMANDPKFMKNKKLPTHKFFTGLATLNKIRALYEYKSQLFAFKKSVPKHIPLWFILSARVFEYYHET